MTSSRVKACLGGIHGRREVGTEPRLHGQFCRKGEQRNRVVAGKAFM